jgi:hypothetical protein
VTTSRSPIRAISNILSSGAQKLDRRVFATSRLPEFTSIKPLTAQTGHTPDSWPLVIVKEPVTTQNNAGARYEGTVGGAKPEISLLWCPRWALPEPNPAEGPGGRARHGTVIVLKGGLYGTDE